MAVKPFPNCKCGGREIRDLRNFPNIPLRDGRHTSAYIGACTSCQGLRGFPHMNFDLVMEEGTSATLMALADLHQDLNR